MPLYRTNSDRGLWKKYRDPQPQHFHKPQYLELEKPKPQVSQSQVQSRRPFPEYGEVDKFEKIKIKKKNLPDSRSPKRCHLSDDLKTA